MIAVGSPRYAESRSQDTISAWCGHARNAETQSVLHVNDGLACRVAAEVESTTALDCPVFQPLNGQKARKRQDTEESGAPWAFGQIKGRYLWGERLPLLRRAWPKRSHRELLQEGQRGSSSSAQSASFPSAHGLKFARNFSEAHSGPSTAGPQPNTTLPWRKSPLHYPLGPL